MTAAAIPTVVTLEPDRSFADRIASAVRAAGARSIIVKEGVSLLRAFDDWPELVVVDLAADWQEPVRRAKRLPHLKRIPIIAFASHEDPGALRAAREIGCEYVRLRAHFIDELPDLLQRVLHPPTRWIEGWDAAPPLLLCRGVEQFNCREYWECHETLEMLWRAEPRPVRDLYQGVLQVGVAFHHLRDCNYTGALKMLRRGLPRLRDLPEICQGLHVAELHRDARAVHDQVVALGPDHIAEFNTDTLPRILLAGCIA
jgi:CheY-like chemotaxis protein